MPKMPAKIVPTDGNVRSNHGDQALGSHSQFDVVIAGGGVMGSSCAYFLHTHPDFRGSIAVIEPDPTYIHAASARSASSIRQQFSTPINISLSMAGLDFLRHPSRRSAVGLVESSYLYLATSAGHDTLEQRIEIQQSLGVPVTIHEGSELATRYPWLNISDLAAGADTHGVEGWFDGYTLLSGLRSVNERGGVSYLRDRVIGLELSRDRKIVAVTLHQGGRLSCCPLVIDPSGLWFRPEGDRFLCGVPADPDPNVSDDDFDVDHDLFERAAWPILAHRVPAFEAVRATSAWAGHYDYNVFDQNAFVGPVPDMPNLLIASGFSGHGLQHAPGIGRGLAEQIIFGEYRSLDLTSLSYARFLANEPLRELNVI